MCCWVTPLLLFVLGRSLADLPWPQRALSVLFRVAFLGLLALGLSRLVRSEETHQVCTVLLVDGERLRAGRSIG